ncbi:UDP-2,3-diacylglucosamine diphosphatase [Minwuia thermotolerans]|uniref:UDP-2,3-diacylglucosamine hydrolase n=1 Tax=Minwuia thermotolerans TaxID=2056226 RepID=A0A2M9G2X0_9PROT|nr:UDP-2,3-diacylglucosamine diphosphatase [Minwuia thermotolerans]PJK30055.1 UDP-2,3-diacylglucosamine hydrolase [Minwuia thermotolerans]
MFSSDTVRCRTIFISDVHLGTRGCQAERLLSFIKAFEADTIYLVGDIVDCWALKRGWFWPQSHNDVVQKLLRQARKGVRVIYIPGNHDEAFRDYCGTHFGGVEVKTDDIHTAADGKRYLVTHGDAFDGVVRYAKWLAVLGDWSYNMLIRVNTVLARVRQRLGLQYWSLSAYLKFKVKNAVQFIDNYETTVADEARRRAVDGVICGHIHHAEIREIEGITYVNDGDWVESCTAVIERQDGRLEIIRWSDALAEAFAEKRAAGERSRIRAA